VLASTDANIPNQDLRYIYDALGNRVRTVENGVGTEYVVNGMNQYLRVGDTDYTFDANGSLTNEVFLVQSRKLSFDFENHLVGVQAGSRSQIYSHDPFGNLAIVNEDGVRTFFLIDPFHLGSVTSDYNDSNVLASRYDHGHGLISRAAEESNREFYCFDGNGDSTQLTDQSSFV